MVDRYFEVSGIASSVGAQLAYVWCRAGGGDGYTLVGSGHVVGADAILPPGIKAGQFAIAIRLPADGVVETIAVTDDVGGGDLVPDVSVIECPAPAGMRAGTAAAGAGFVVSSKLPMAPFRPPRHADSEFLTSS